LREQQRLRVPEDRVLKRTYRPMRDKVTGKWRKLHTKELNDLYSSPKIIRVIKSRRKRRGREGNLRETDHLKTQAEIAGYY
jgi:hypothetical protein